MESPIQRTFGLPELLVAILRLLDTKTLLLSQRVCTRWRNIIADTSELQQALFFEPIQPTSPTALTTDRTKNPLLAENFPSFFQEHERDNGVNKIYSVLFSEDTPLEGIVPASRSLSPYFRRGASWRRMLVQQAAAPVLGFAMSRGRPEPSFYYGQLERTGGGLRMGTLYDAVYSFVGREVDPCTFGVYWREPQYDPPVRSDSSKNGGFEISLSQFDEDVAVVVILSTEEPEWGDTPAYISPDTTTREQLVGRFLPEEWEERPVGLTWANSQCWFG